MDRKHGSDYSTQSYRDEKLQERRHSKGNEKGTNAKTDEQLKKALEVRKRLDDAIAAGKRVKTKKGFLNPERKRKLRVLLLEKAAQDVKAEQERKVQERRRVLEERIGSDQHSGAKTEADLKEICGLYHKRIRELENSKYDLEVAVRARDYVLNELTIQVNDLHGKFLKPTLKKVDKFDEKSSKLVRKESGASDYRWSLRRRVVPNKFDFEEEKDVSGCGVEFCFSPAGDKTVPASIDPSICGMKLSPTTPLPLRLKLSLKSNIYDKKTEEQKPEWVKKD